MENLYAVKGKAEFLCRNKEEATWYAHLINMFFINLEIEVNEEHEGIKATILEVNPEKDKYKLSVSFDIRLNEFENELNSTLSLLYFLEKQTKLVDCNIAFEGNPSWNHFLLEKRDEGTNSFLNFVKFRPSYLKIPLDINRDFFLYDFIKKSKKIFSTFSGKRLRFLVYPEDNNPLKNLQIEIIDSFGKKKKFKAIDILDVFLNVFSFDSEINIYQKILDSLSFKNQRDWKKHIQTYSFNISDVDNLIKNNFKEFTYSFNLDVNFYKFQYILNVLMTNFFKQIKEEKIKIVMLYNSSQYDFITDSIALVISFNNIQNKDNKIFCYTTLIYGEIVYEDKFRIYFDEYIKTHLSLNKSEIDRRIVFPIYLIEYENDFYEYCRKLPKINVDYDISIPLTTVFVMAFNNSLLNEKYSIKQINKDIHFMQENDGKPFCYYCKNNIRKYTTDCSSCSDFGLRDIFK